MLPVPSFFRCFSPPSPSPMSYINLMSTMLRSKALGLPLPADSGFFHSSSAGFRAAARAGVFARTSADFAIMSFPIFGTKMWCSPASAYELTCHHRSRNVYVVCNLKFLHFLLDFAISDLLSLLLSQGAPSWCYSLGRVIFGYFILECPPFFN